MTVDSIPRQDLPKNGIYGLEVSRASATTLSIAQGRTRDSSNKMDIGVGADYPQYTRGNVSAPLALDMAVVGANGIDAGAIGASKVYAVYVIADSSGENTVAALASLASNSVPTMPFGYDAYAKVGYAISDSGSEFLAMSQLGLGHSRRLLLDAPFSVASAASNTTFTAIDLSSVVAPMENVIVQMQVDLAANAAGDIFAANKFGGTADFYVARAAYATGTGTDTHHAFVPVGLDSGAPKILTKVSAGSYSLYIKGFQYEL